MRSPSTIIQGFEEIQLMYVYETLDSKWNHGNNDLNLSLLLHFELDQGAQHNNAIHEVDHILQSPSGFWHQEYSPLWYSIGLLMLLQTDAAFVWQGHLVLTVANLCHDQNFFRSTIIQSNWVAEQFVKRCWEMVCMPVMVPGGSNAIHISSSFMRASWSFCSGRMEASCNRCL